jgi:hypothetical protein
VVGVGRLVPFSCAQQRGAPGRGREVVNGKVPDA